MTSNLRSLKRLAAFLRLFSPFLLESPSHPLFKIKSLFVGVLPPYNQKMKFFQRNPETLAPCQLTAAATLSIFSWNVLKGYSAASGVSSATYSTKSPT